MLLAMTRGVIYVYREVHGEQVPLWVPQTQYKEWLGCFSAL